MRINGTCSFLLLNLGDDKYSIYSKKIDSCEPLLMKYEWMCKPKKITQLNLIAMSQLLQT
jgi:hypothetical protein